MARNRRQQEEANLLVDIFKLIGAISVIPIYRYAKLFTAKEPLKENLKESAGEYFLNGLLLCMFLSALVSIGYWKCFDYQLTFAWWLAGGIGLLLLLCFYAGYLKRRKKTARVSVVKEKIGVDKDYREIMVGLKGLGYTPEMAQESADYVTQNFSSEPLNSKMYEAIKYFDARS